MQCGQAEGGLDVYLNVPLAYAMLIAWDYLAREGGRESGREGDIDFHQHIKTHYRANMLYIIS